MQTKGFHRILLATDGSAQAGAAVAVTASFAHASSAAVRAVHVWSLEVHHRKGVWDIEMLSEAEKLIGETTGRLRSAGVVAEGTISRADSQHVAIAVADAARAFEADLVVVGSRGLSDWQSMRKHSVSHQLLSALDCPLLIVRDQKPEAVHDAERVVLAIAGGDDVTVATRAAIAAASAPGSRVLVVHVPQAIVSVQGLAYVEPDAEIAETLKRATAMLEGAGVAAEVMVAQPGPVAQVVAATAAGWKADVIVIGSSRMGDLGSLLLGSVTHDLLRVAKQPVLVAERTKQ
jgi:nucleotide-binding universal stress UspA family protein